jgi:medium-chain acyl-[acyl-carrier-protein] hydrolase
MTKHISWFASPARRPQASLRLFCFPYAGGGSLIYRPWAAQLPPSVELYAAHLPGHENRLREPPFTNLFPLVEAIAEVIPPYLDKPFAFFGHSMGAMISFELARLLRRRNGPMPSALYVSGRPAPQIPRPEPFSYNLPEEEFKQKLLSLNGTPPEVLEHPEVMELLIPIVRADFSVVETYEYKPEPPLDVPLVAFGGLQDAAVTKEEVEAWREQTSSTFRLWMIPGDHFFLNSAQRLLLYKLSQELTQLERQIAASNTGARGTSMSARERPGGESR